MSNFPFPNPETAMLANDLSHRFAVRDRQLIVALTGEPGAGKDTTAHLIESMFWDFAHLRFASALDALIENLFGPVVVQRAKANGSLLWGGLTRDMVYQQAGEVLRDQFGDNLFAESIARKCINLWQPHIGSCRHVVISDCRRAVEINTLVDMKHADVLLLQIARPAHQNAREVSSAAQAALAKYRADLSDAVSSRIPASMLYTICNDGTQADLQTRLLHVLDKVV